MANKKKNYTTAGITKRELDSRIKSNRAMRKKSYEGGITSAKEKKYLKTYKSMKKTKSLDATYTQLSKKKKSMNKPFGSAGGYN